jgi:hypothetical protein
VHRYAGAGTCRADTAASGGMICLSYHATRHDRTCERTKCAQNRTICTWEAMRDELPLSRTKSAIRNSATQRFHHAQRMRLVSGYRAISAVLRGRRLDADQDKGRAYPGILRA